ncbi:voltage-dependent T-type calcium channel subunit alpha-1I-like, partial [Callorhinchus milii]|uniref:voltage-dependent T-type calcium channel subunit alpha-1I-like n=1 Tax=Callorhinchus milii TaxID=7868 RepID=UPI001C3F509D
MLTTCRPDYGDCDRSTGGRSHTEDQTTGTSLRRNEMSSQRNSFSVDRGRGVWVKTVLEPVGSPPGMAFGHAWEVLKLLKMATGMRALLDTVVQALPQVGNLGLLFMLLFFIYAALGVELFGRLVCNEDYPCEGMSRHATFENFGMAFLTLFQVSTGDNWNGIMKDTLRDCNGEDRTCLTNLQLISPLYFVSFVLTAQFVLINVVVAVLMKHLDDSNKEALEDAELDAEIELEQAQKLCGPGA